MSQVGEFHYHEVTANGETFVVPHPTSARDCVQCKGVGHTYEGGTEWGIRNRLEDDESLHYTAQMRKEDALRLHKTQLAYAKTRWPDEPGRWPELVSAHITWRVEA